jgi:Zn-dependent M28 family amino/carboxypeptidase
MAHLDGYFDAANDNAGGLAALLALARHFSVNEKDRPRRRHVFLGTSGHHEFSDGAKAFIAAHPDVIEQTVLVLNIEHPSSISSYYRGPFIFGRGTLPGQLIATTSQGKRAVTVSNNNPFLLSLYKESVDRYGLVVDAMQERRPNGDAFDFFLAGLTVVQILDANLWFHSSGDRPDTIHPHGLERAVRQYADVLDQVDKADSENLGK